MADMRHDLVVALVLVVAVVIGGTSHNSHNGTILFTNLAVNHLKNPIGIDTPKPRLRWSLYCTATAHSHSTKGCGVVAAYRVMVASEKADLTFVTHMRDVRRKPDMWDSGVIQGSELSVKYQGETLHSRKLCYYRIQLFDMSNETYISPIGYFEMGLLDKKAWKGSNWISRTNDKSVEEAPYLRKHFTLPTNVTATSASATVSRARLYMSGLGFARVLLNGKHITKNVMDPTFTRYDKRVLYTTYDITKAIQTGFSNMSSSSSSFIIGVILGNGWFNHITETVWDYYRAPWRAAPKMLLQLYVEYSDGSNNIISSDLSWETRSGPLVRNCLYGGEVYSFDLEDDLGAWADLPRSKGAEAVEEGTDSST